MTDSAATWVDAVPAERLDELGAAGLTGLLGELRDTVAFIDPSGRVLLTNGEVTAGGEEAAAIDVGEAAVRFRPDGERYESWELPVIRSVRAGEVVRDEECVRLAADGARHFLSCRSAPIRDEEGTIVAAVLVERDITTEKRAQTRLARLAPLLDNADLAVIALDGHGRITAWNRGAASLYGWGAPCAVGRQILRLLKPDLDLDRQIAIRDAVGEQGRWRGEVSVEHRDGSAVLVDITGIAIRGPGGQVAGYVSTHRDVTDRQRARLELERQIAQQASVAGLGLRALRDGSLTSLFEDAAGAVRHGLGVEYCRVDQLLPGGREIRVRAAAGWRDGAVVGLVLPAGRRSLAGFALHTGGPVLVDDLGVDARFDAPVDLRQHGVTSAMAVMIDPLGKPFGPLLALSTRRRSFSEQDVSFAQSVANVLATAIDRAEIDRRLDEVRTAERARIARDLHDEALRELNDLFALATLSRPAAGGAGDDGRWAALISGLAHVGQQLRSAIYDLRQTTDDERGFADLLAGVVASQADVVPGIEVWLSGESALPAGSLGHRGAELLRIVREAITNARRHSGWTSVVVDASRSTGDAVRIDVGDDGRWPGRADAVSDRRGAGLAAMFDRAGQLGATLRIGARAGGGTLVSVELSLDAGAAALPNNPL